MSDQFFRSAELQGFLRLSRLGEVRRVLIVPSDEIVVRFYAPEFTKQAGKVYAAGGIGLALLRQPGTTLLSGGEKGIVDAETIGWHLLNVDSFRREMSGDVSEPETATQFAAYVKSLLFDLPSSVAQLRKASRDVENWVGKQLLTWNDSRVQSFKRRLEELSQT
jgi:hypothetical protein